MTSTPAVTPSLRQLAEAATPGPWEWEYGVSQRTAWALVRHGGPTYADDQYVLRFKGPNDITVVPDPEADMDYIAAANPSVVLALIEERDRLAEALEQGIIAAAHRRSLTAADIEAAWSIVTSAQELADFLNARLAALRDREGEGTP